MNKQLITPNFITLPYRRRVFLFYCYILRTTHPLSVVKVIMARSLPGAQNSLYKFSLNGDDETSFVPDYLGNLHS